MSVSRVDPQSLSTRAALEGGCALDAGNTVLARQKYTEAGDILDRASRKRLPAADKHLLRFLAASQYYRAGEYHKALKLAERVNPGHLRPGHRDLLADFRKTVAERTDAGYARRIQQAVLSCLTEKRVEEGLKLLHHHPYAFGRSQLAGLRGELSYLARRWHLAAQCYADSLRYSGSHPTPTFWRATGALPLLAAGDIEAAQEYTSLTLVNEPTALDYVTACAVCFRRLMGGDESARGELLRLFSHAETTFAQLPASTQADPDVRDLMAHGYLLAATATDRLGDRGGAMRLIQTGLTLFPSSSEGNRFRSILANAGQWFDRRESQAAEPAVEVRKQSRPADFEWLFGPAA